MMYITDNPIADFNRYDRGREREIRKLPRCTECDEHILDEYAYYINDEWICSKCLNENYRREVDAD